MGDAMFVTDVSQCILKISEMSYLEYSGFWPAKRGEKDVEVLKEPKN